MTNATKADRKHALEMIERLTVLMNGGEVDGVKMGATGVSFEWVKSTRDHYAGMMGRINAALAL